MKKSHLIFVGVALLSVVFISCIDNEYGVVDLTPIPKEEIPDTEYGTLSHPCMLLTSSDFSYIKEKLAEEPDNIQNRALNWQTRSDNNYTQKNYSASPVKYLARLDNSNWGSYNSRWEEAGYTEEEWVDMGGTSIPSNYMNFDHDCAAAFGQAILWKITGDEDYARNVATILNSWANNNKGYVVNKSTGEFVDPNENLIALEIYQICNAAELMRDYSAFNLSNFKTWIQTYIYPVSSRFLSHEGEACPVHYWFNWDLANLNAILSIGILLDDNEIINEAIKYYKYGNGQYSGSGYFSNGMPFRFADPDGTGEMFSQCQESGRDQGHTSLCCAMLAYFCKAALNVGEDIFAYPDNEYWPLGMFEYYSKYNLGTSEYSTGSGWLMSGFVYSAGQVGFESMTKCTNSGDQTWSELSYEEKQSGEDTRGTVTPAWELMCRLAADANQPHEYCAAFLDVMRSNASRGYTEGGAGDYGPNSGGFDTFGWGSLIFAK